MVDNRIDENDIYFAGLHDDNGQFCIITRESINEKISEIHHRQPVIINKSQINNYLNLNNDAVNFLKSIKVPKLKFHRISKKINIPTNNDPSLINPIEVVN